MKNNKEQTTLKNAVKLKTSELLGYGVGNAAQNMAFLMVSLYLLYFYTDVLKIPAAIAGTIFLVTRLVDAIFDPTVGYIADRTNTKLGRFRPYILFGAIPLAVLTILCFTAPNFSDTGKIAYAFTTYLFQSLALSAVVIPYFSLAPVLTQDPHERTKIQTFNLVLASIAMVIISVGTKPIVAMFPNEKMGFQYTVMIYMAIAVILFMICFASVTEKVQKTEKKEKKHSLKETLKFVGTNTPLLLIASGYVFYSIAFSVRMSAILYYFKYNLGKEGLTAIFMLTAVVASLIGIIVTLPISKKFGKRNAYLGSTVLTIIGNVALFFVPYSNILMVFVVGSIIVFSSNIALVCHWAMLPDTVEYGQWKTGRRGEGITYGVIGFVQKLGNAIAGAASGLILAFVGYIPNVVQTPKAMNGILHLMTTLPLICAILCFVLLYFYKIDDNMFKTIIQELADRETAES